MTIEKTTKACADAAREIANLLFSGPCGYKEGPRCLEREEKRKLTKAEKDRGWSRRPFSGYDPNNMCRACSTYWHAERAAQLCLEAVHLRCPLFPDVEHDDGEKLHADLAAGVTGATTAVVVKFRPGVMVSFQDPQRIPRAWATGPKEKLEAVREEAARQLVTYRAKKRELGDELADAEFTEHVDDVSVPA